MDVIGHTEFPRIWDGITHFGVGLSCCIIIYLVRLVCFDENFLLEFYHMFFYNNFYFKNNLYLYKILD